MAVKFDIFNKNIELSDKVKDYVEKKVSKLDKFLSHIDETRVDLSYEKNARNVADRYVSQITIRGKGFILRSEESADNLLEAVDKSVAKIERQIERFKGKRVRSRTQPVDEKLDIEDEAGEEEEEAGKIVRRKTFTLIPMDEREAMEQMALLGHDNFFVFYNANTSRINVLYRRNDGAYGLIEPVIG